MFALLLVGHVLFGFAIGGGRKVDGSCPPEENKPMAGISSIQFIVQTTQGKPLWGIHLQWVEGS